jgi:hypothetical protein
MRDNLPDIAGQFAVLSPHKKNSRAGGKWATASSHSAAQTLASQLFARSPLEHPTGSPEETAHKRNLPMTLKWQVPSYAKNGNTHK